MYHTFRSLFRRRNQTARSSRRTRLRLETLEARSLLAATLSGFVYVDANDNGIRDLDNNDNPETPIPGVTLTLTGTDINGNAVNLTTTTGTDGSYSFTGLAVSNAAGYTLTETQPSGFLPGKNALGTVNNVTVGSLASPTVDTMTAITLSDGNDGIDYDFGELQPARLAGFVYVDANNDGVRQASETPVTNVTITLTGTDDLGASVSLTTTTAADGSYAFANLRPSSAAGYTLTETQPDSFALGKNAAGSAGGTVGATSVSAISVGSGTNGTENNFALLPPASLGGVTFADFNNDGLQNGPDFRLGGVALLLQGTDTSGNPVFLFYFSAADGTYQFNNLAPGSYTLSEFLPSGFAVGKSVAGSAGGTGGTNQVTNIHLPLAAAATGYNFGAVPAVNPSGNVFIDSNNNGVLDAGEPGIAGVQVAISGTDVLGNNIFQNQTTDAHGHYHFSQLAPGTYTILEAPPIGYFVGKLQNGSPPAATLAPASNGANFSEFIGIDLTSAPFTQGYNFGHLLAGFPVAVNPVGAVFPQVNPTFIGTIQLVGNGPINNVVYVNALYQQILGRAPDVEGVNFWVYLLDVGVSRSQVAAAFWQSVEHRRDQVDFFYLTFLHRQADAAGELFWVNAFLRGASETDVAAQFLTSPEYLATHPDNTSFITGLYQDILAHGPDAGGLAYWQQQLQNGVSQLDVARAILT